MSTANTNKKYIVIASDHAGYKLKEYIKNYIQNSEKHSKNIKLIDCGTDSTDSVDYPEYAKKLCKEIIEENNTSRGILICGTGIGVSIAANKYHKNIHAALCHDVVGAQRARQHNNSNVLCLGSLFVTEEMSEAIINIWLETEFSSEPRHRARIDSI